MAAFGRAAQAVEVRVHRDSRVVGTAYGTVLCTGAAALGVAGGRVTRHRPVAAGALTALATWTVLGGTTLRREATAMAALLDADDLPGARLRIRHLCGRDADRLDAGGLARAAVESIAENTSDAVVAPLLWGAVAGLPGLLAYRAVNTLDAMVGHRSPRHLRFGWAAARADDLANVVPARVTALLAVALAPVVGGRRDAGLRAWHRDGSRHPSPNAGQVEAAFAGVLGRTLGGPVTYAGRLEHRHLLGDGPAPDVADIARSARLSGAVSLAAAALAVGLRVGLDRAGSRRTGRAARQRREPA